MHNKCLTWLRAAKRRQTPPNAAERREARLAAMDQPQTEESFLNDVIEAEVWNYISVPANYGEFSHVKEFRSDGNGIGSQMSLITRRGYTRYQTIVMLEPEAMRLSYSVVRNDYPTDKQWFYGFEVSPAGNNNVCRVVMSVYFCLEPMPPQMKKAIDDEFKDIAPGLKKSSGEKP